MSSVKNGEQWTWTGYNGLELQSEVRESNRGMSRSGTEKGIDECNGKWEAMDQQWSGEVIWHNGQVSNRWMQWSGEAMDVCNGPGHYTGMDWCNSKQQQWIGTMFNGWNGQLQWSGKAMWMNAIVKSRNGCLQWLGDAVDGCKGQKEILTRHLPLLGRSNGQWQLLGGEQIGSNGWEENRSLQ